MAAVARNFLVMSLTLGETVLEKSGAR